METSVSPVGTVLVLRVWFESADRSGFRGRIMYCLEAQDSFTSVAVTSPEAVLDVVRHFLDNCTIDTGTC
jgi:hypothetical protein